MSESSNSSDPKEKPKRRRQKGSKKKKRRALEISKGKVRFCEKLNELGFGSYYEYLKSPHWKSFKAKVRKSTKPKKCQVCGSRSGLELHHVTYDNLGNESLSDVMYLCREHHEATHVYSERYKHGLGASVKRVKRLFLKKLKPSSEYELREEARLAEIPKDDTPSRKQIADGSTHRTGKGWKASVLAKWGVPYPPPGGWRDELERKHKAKKRAARQMENP